MNYPIIYNRLIDRAKQRDVPMGYLETHHIVPRCMGGSDNSDNLVKLTPEEHYLAHQLLVRIYPSVPGLVRAAICMSANPHGRRGNKSYGWLRRRYSVIASDHMRGRIKTPEHLAAISAALKGKSHSVETREKISKAHKGKKHSAEIIEARASKLRGRERSEQCKQKLSSAFKGKKISLETRKKMSEAIAGKPRGARGSEAKKNISTAMKLIWQQRRIKQEEDRKRHR